MFREGLAGVLTAYGGLEVVAQTSNDDGAVALARQKKPDVVIMQVQVPFEKAKAVLDTMRALQPAPKVIIVTMFEDPTLMREFLRLGASGYVLKSSSSTELISAIRIAAFASEDKNIVVGLPRQLLEEAEGGSEGVLSVRELEYPASGRPRPLEPPDSHKGAPGGGNRQAPSHQHLPPDGDRLPRRGR